jgi:integrase
MSGTPKTFSDLAPLYLAQRRVTKTYELNVTRVASRARLVTAEDLNRHLRARAEAVESTTARSERTILLSLWRWAYDAGVVEHAPRGIMRIKIRRRPTKAWTVPQLRQLLDATKAHDGKVLRSGADLGLFLRCWILICYETGSRFGDCMAFTRDNLRDDALAWTQSKTGDPLMRPLTPACLTAIDSMLAKSPDGRILGWACGRRMAMRWMRTVIDSIGIGGTSKFLRRSGATHVEMEKAGSGRLHLGHRSPALFEQAYCDWSQLRTKTPKTPALM